MHKAQRWNDLLQASRALLKQAGAHVAKTPLPKVVTQGSRVPTFVVNRYIGSYGDVAMRFFGEAAVHTSQWDELQNTVETRLKLSPKDHAALQYAAVVAMHKRDFTAAAKRIEEASTSGYMQPIPDTLLRDWIKILAHNTNPDDTTDSYQSSLFSGSEEDTSTKALLQLAQGKEDEFHRSFVLALARSDESPSDGIPWLVQSELLKHYGLDDQAAQALTHLHQAKYFGELDWAALLLESEEHHPDPPSQPMRQPSP